MVAFMRRVLVLVVLLAAVPRSVGAQDGVPGSVAAHCRVDVPPTPTVAAAQALVAEIHRHCPRLGLFRDHDGHELAASAVMLQGLARTRTSVRLVNDQTPAGSAHVRCVTAQVDLRACTASVAVVDDHDGWNLPMTVWSTSPHPAQPVPTPAGTAFHANDPAFAGTQATYTTRMAHGDDVMAGVFTVYTPFPATPPPPMVAPPVQEPPTFLTADDLRAIGTGVDAPAHPPVATWTLLASYRTTLGIAPPTLALHTGSYDVLDGAFCSFVRRGATQRRVWCDGAPRTWLGGDGHVAIAFRSGHVNFPFLLLDLERGQASFFDLPEVAIDDAPGPTPTPITTPPRPESLVHDGLFDRGPAARVTLVALLAAMRASTTAPAAH